MLRKLINVCTFASLLMAALCTWCWVQSESKVGQFSLERDGREALRIWSFEGNFIASRSVSDVATDKGSGQVAWASTPRLEHGVSPIGLPLASGFSYQSHPLKDNKGIETILILPAWAVTAVFMFLPAWFIAKKIKPRSKEGKKKAAA